MPKRIELSYEPFDKTVDIHRAFHTHKIRVAVTGARGGKTTMGVADVRDRAIIQPDYWDEDLERGEPYTIGIGAPDYPTLERVILPAWLRGIPSEIIVRPYHGVKREMVIQGKRGHTQVYFLSAGRPESWQGLRLYGAWIDEFPLINELMFDEVQARLSDRRGWLLLTGTPRGPNWAKKRLFDPWLDKSDKRIFFTTWKTIDNPHIDKEEIERLRRTMPPKYFKRTFEASWDVFQGQIYEEFVEQVHVVDPEEFTFILPSGRRSIGKGEKTIRFLKVIGGVDWGYGVDHPGAILVMGLSRNNVWYIVEESFGEQVLVTSHNQSMDTWVKRAKALHAKWEVKMFFADGASPQNIASFRGSRIPVTPALKTVKEGIQVVADSLRVNEDDMSVRLQILNTCKNTISEMVYYHWKPGKEEPEKSQDHTMDALRYAMYTFHVRGVFVRERNYVPL